MTAAAARTAADGISRLPRAARDEVSAALADGATWRVAAEICARHGLRGVTAQNVSNYRRGPHRRWLEREERLAAIRRDSEATADIVLHYTRHGGSPAEAGVLAAAEILSRSLAGLGPETLAELIADEPKTFFSAVRELSRLTAVLDRRPAPPVQPAADAASRPALGPDDIRQIFGLPPAPAAPQK